MWGLPDAHILTGDMCDTSKSSKHYLYDDLGRRDSVITGFDNQMFMEQTTYDQYGRVFQQFDASGNFNGVRHYYNDRGYAYKQVEARYSGGSDATVYYEVIATDAFGNVSEFNQNDGKITTIKEYDPQTGFLTGITASKGSNVSLQNTEYKFDSLGRLRERENNTFNSGVLGHFESYEYDKLSRLTHINETEVVSYFANGNIKWKSDVRNGQEAYYCYQNTQPHAVSGLGNSEGCSNKVYRYDANGNMTEGKGRVISYSHFSKPKLITANGASTNFEYDLNRNRYKRETTKDNVTTTTYYVGNVEVVYKDSQYSEIRRYLPDAIQTQYKGGAIKTHYLHKDHLGSIDSITNESGDIVEKLYFDAWGKRYSIAKVDWIESVRHQAATTLVNVLSISGRGFTGHEHVDHADIIHMNGRIYDPTLGRFLQADPFIQAPRNSQSYNRYSYVLNNPLSYTDPSGYFFKSLFKKINKALGNFAPFVAASLMFIPGVGQWAAASMWNAAVVGFAAGGIATGSLRGALVGAFTGAAFQQIGQHFNTKGIFNKTGNRYGYTLSGDKLHSFGGNLLTSGQITQQIASHAVVGGVAAELAGGKFGHGFFSAGVTKGLGGAFLPSGSNLNTGEIVEGTVISSVIGGTASEISGGKFANGASTGAFQFLFNQASKARACSGRPCGNRNFNSGWSFGDPLPQGVVDFSAGFGDFASFGGTKAIRQFWNFDSVSYESGSYLAGTYTGAVHMSLITGGAGLAGVSRSSALANTYMLGGVGTSFANDPTGAAMTNASIATAAYTFGQVNPTTRMIANMFSPNIALTQTTVSEFWSE